MVENPFAGKYVEDLSELMAIGEELANCLTQRAVAALGISPAKVESYGKAAAVGENGEIEHAAAILHPKLGAPVRKFIGKEPRSSRPPKNVAAWAWRWTFART